MPRLFLPKLCNPIPESIGHQEALTVLNIKQQESRWNQTIGQGYQDIRAVTALPSEDTNKSALLSKTTAATTTLKKSTMLEAKPSTSSEVVSEGNALNPVSTRNQPLKASSEIFAYHATPYDAVLLYNIAVVLQKHTAQMLKDERSNFKTVRSAVNHLQLSHSLFSYLSMHENRGQYDPAQTAAEANQCQDLLSQAQYHVTRAERQDQEERENRHKQEEERMALKQKRINQKIQKSME